MDSRQFREEAHRLVDWMADYLEHIREYPVKSQVAPGDIYKQLPDNAPESGEAFGRIFEDFQKIIIPGMTQ
jgi:aromatic-L-amino-acid decarboxylase